MSPFAPIAIVGQACLLPGANDPAQLWEAVASGRDLLSIAPADRWGAARSDVIGTPEHCSDRSWSERGGYVHGFEQIFDPNGLSLDADEIMRLDPLFVWLLHVGRQALRSAAIADTSRAGAVVGNLSFPTTSMARYAERVWLGDELADAADLPIVDPRNRFSSGLPAHLLARALDLGEAAYCLDAACASSLVAIKLACDRLHDGSADVMLAGAVNRCDDLFIHVGFCALQAMSRSGRSRPFHPHADGLVPAEGAGMVVLQRLADAVQQGRTILGVIRGIGLSNDGRGSGLLAPSQSGQVRAMQRAYACAGLTPDDIDYAECHATGTPVGDATELDSMRQVFGEQRRLPIGSLKSNLGHLITAAGVASLIKVLAAMDAETLPATLHLDDAQPIADDPSFEVVTTPRPWPATQRPRRATVSAFGFGGNNAHLIVEQWRGQSIEPQPASAASPRIAVVALASRELSEGDDIQLPLKDLRFPPRDMEQTLPQQLLMMAVAAEALSKLDQLPHQQTGVLIGMGCDPNVARWGARWRLSHWARRWGIAQLGWRAQARDAFVPSLLAAGVLGTMPNVVANRLNSAFDLGGASMSVSSEEMSGLRALEVGARALRRGELDAAIVGAVDMSREPVHQAAAAALGVAGDSADAALGVGVGATRRRPTPRPPGAGDPGRRCVLALA